MYWPRLVSAQQASLSSIAGFVFLNNRSTFPGRLRKTMLLLAFVLSTSEMLKTALMSGRVAVN